MSFKRLLFGNMPSFDPSSRTAAVKNELTKRNMPAPQTSSPDGTNLFRL
jgi:hypothetical protein